ncbi:hypothetical protein V8D89_012039 [Ganoderma adspersum]
MFVPLLPAPVQLRTLSGYSPSPPLDETFGAVLIGTFFSLMLYGITLHQTFRYHALYPSDRPLLKFAVYSTVILETAHMVLSCHTCNYANHSSLQYPVRVWWSGYLKAFLLVALGKQFRIWVFIADHSVFALWIIATSSAMAVCADFILSTVLIIALRQSRSGVARTDSALDVLVLYTITTGLLTSVTMLTLFVFVVLRPADLIYTSVSLVSTKRTSSFPASLPLPKANQTLTVYANALLAAAKTYHYTDQSGLEIQTLGGQVLPRTAFDQPTAIELPELPKRPHGPDERTTSDGGGCPWSEALTESEGLRLYSDSESRSTLWEAESLRDAESIATAV